MQRPLADCLEQVLPDYDRRVCAVDMLTLDWKIRAAEGGVWKEAGERFAACVSRERAHALPFSRGLILQNGLTYKGLTEDDTLMFWAHGTPKDLRRVSREEVVNQDGRRTSRFRTTETFSPPERGYYEACATRVSDWLGEQGADGRPSAGDGG